MKKCFTLAKGVIHVGTFDTCRKPAFTLAEVLITLGIIGVVASMTIPTLVQNYNTRTWNTGAKVFERKLEEALKTMNTQMTLAGHHSTESFVEELSKHFKTNKICQNDELLDCFSDVVYWGVGETTPEEVDMSIIKTAENFGQDDWNTNIVSVQFANGTSAMIAYNPTGTCTQDPYSNQVTGADCLAILYDVSASKNPNTSGKDLRSLNVSQLGSGCFAEIDGVCLAMAPQVANAVTKAECEQMITEGYGITGCYYDDDYWAGSVKICGGVNNVATIEDLAKIASYIYGTEIDPTVKVGNCFGCNGSSISLNPDRAAELGFSMRESDNAFFVNSRTEYNAEDAYIRAFNDSSTTSYKVNKDVQRQVVCVK